MKIAVVMPSYLGEYHGCASNRTEKFLRAVESFKSQTYQDKVLVVVSDGCEITDNITLNDDNIELIHMKKQPLFSGEVRMTGVDYAVDCEKADIITYLDTDDYLEPNHLSNICEAFEQNECDWVYCNDKVGDQLRETKLAWSKIGTSNISHKASVPMNWGNGYGHDWAAIQGIMKYKSVKADFASYIVCHIPNVIDI